MARMKRGVGYCYQTQCDDYAKGVFLLNHQGEYYCSHCRVPGEVRVEEGKIRNNYPVFKEVRVEYNYDPLQRRFREIAIVRDESLWGECNTYTLMSPLIRTEKRALKVAEAMLANLNRYGGQNVSNEIPAQNELVLDIGGDAVRYYDHLSKLEKMWKESPLAREKRV